MNYAPKPDENGVRWYGGNVAHGRPPTREDTTHCIASVSTYGRLRSFHQCRRSRGYGEDGLYCKQHDPAAYERRREKAVDNYARKMLARMKPEMDLRDKLAACEAERDSLRAEVERLREALEKMRSWADAYPLDVFPEPDMARVANVLRREGMTLDAVAASVLRRALRGVGDDARAALEVKP